MRQPELRQALDRHRQYAARQAKLIHEQKRPAEHRRQIGRRVASKQHPLPRNIRAIGQRTMRQNRHIAGGPQSQLEIVRRHDAQRATAARGNRKMLDEAGGHGSTL
jgi:hypothetical protein